MATRRGVQSFDIFQDPNPVTSAHLYEPAYSTHHNPLSEISHSQINILNLSHSPSSVIPPPSHSHFHTDSPQKKQQLLESNHYNNYPNPLSSAPFPELPQYDKENSHGAQKNKSNSFSYSHSMANTISSDARTSPSNEKTSNKKHKKNDSTSRSVSISGPQSWSSTEDDGTKPPLSYSQLIAMAILRSSDKKLTLANIYKFITDSFKYYRTGCTGWQNSIRHNLSLNKSFVKITRAKEDPGKGHYWGIEPGSELAFLKEPKKPPTYNQGLSSHKKRPSTAQSHSSHTASKIVDSARFPDDDEELSSDATIPASDPAIHEGIVPDTCLMPPPAKVMRSSPPPADVTSSPPAIHVSAIRELTPPLAHEFVMPKTLSGGNRKRKHSLLGDSGYYSSIESSATRNPRGCLTSDADHDHPMLKRGRAEEEIARIRGSSYDSPSKPRTNGAAISSSPFRTMGLKAPLTPATMFKRPAKPPMSVSPNTSLLEHRKVVRSLLGSPDKGLGMMQSPATNNNVNLLALDYSAWTEGNNENELTWDTFINFTSPLRESPLKRTMSQGERSSKRPRLGRANTTANILANITNEGRGSFTSQIPVLSPSKSLKSPPSFFSPSKISSKAETILVDDDKNVPKFLQKTLLETLLENVHEEQGEDYSFALNLPSDDSEGGVDILQGFQRIGAPAPTPIISNAPSLAPPAITYGGYTHRSPARTRNIAPARPNGGQLSRRSTTMF